MRFCFFWFFKNCELIRDSSLWHSNFILLVHDLVIIIRSRSVTYTFGSHFTYKRWDGVSIKIWISAFLGKYFNIIYWVSKRVDWGLYQCLLVLVTIGHYTFSNVYLGIVCHQHKRQFSTNLLERSPVCQPCGTPPRVVNKPSFVE